MDWITDLVTKRLAQRTNVFIAETFDMKRVEQLKGMLKNEKFSQLCKTKFDNIIEYNMQRNKLTNLTNNVDLQVDPMRASPLTEIDNFLRTAKSVVVVYYVFAQRHADTLADYLVAWSQDDKLHSRKSTVVVFASDVMLFNDSLRRLVYPITIIPSTTEERKSLLQKVSKNIKEAFKEKFDKTVKLKVPEDILQASAGLDLHSTETAAMESFFQHRKFATKTFTDYKISILRNHGVEYVIPNRGFESVGGYDLLKDYVRKRIIDPIHNPEKTKHYGLSIPRGILLYGYYGTGKSWFAKCLSKEIGLPMIKMTPADIMRGIVGETEARVRQLTQLIESLSPVIVFIDEYDQLALSRKGQFIGDSGVSRRMQNMLLEWLGDENRKSFIVGATNFVEQIDQAFLRTGRIDKVVLVLLPDRKARAEILKVHTSVVRKVPVKNVDFNSLAEKTSMFTGAELERLVLDSAAVAMDENDEFVKQSHFEKALENIKINTSERLNRIQAMINEASKLENVDRQFLNDAVKEFVKQEPEASRLKGLIESL